MKRWFLRLAALAAYSIAYAIVAAIVFLLIMVINKQNSLTFVFARGMAGAMAAGIAAIAIRDWIDRVAAKLTLAIVLIFWAVSLLLTFAGAALDQTWTTELTGFCAQAITSCVVAWRMLSSEQISN